MKTRSLFLFIALSTSIFAADIEYLGQTWDFAEPDMLTEIYDKIANDKDKIEARMKANVEKEKRELENLSVKNPIELPRAEKNDIYEIDMTYTLDKDVYDGEGRLLYQKGYKINPSNYVRLSKSLVVIDSSDREQVEWLKREHISNNIYFKILVCKGVIVPLIKELKQPVFQYMDVMHQRLKLRHTPTIITQENNHIIAHEICIDCAQSQQKGDKRKKTMKPLLTSKK